MPCDGSHLEPTEYERESKKACEHIMFLDFRYRMRPWDWPMSKTGGMEIPDWVKEGAEDTYGCPDRIDEVTALLCSICKKAPDRVIYNGKDKKARKLADWWDDHQEADRKKKAAKMSKKARDKARKSGLAKLTDEERGALDL
jgi:hypothetical protein